MANTTYEQNVIRNGIYGYEVRKAMADAIQKLSASPDYAPTLIEIFRLIGDAFQNIPNIQTPYLAKVNELANAFNSDILPAVKKKILCVGAQLQYDGNTVNEWVGCELGTNRTFTVSIGDAGYTITNVTVYKMTGNYESGTVVVTRPIARSTITDSVDIQLPDTSNDYMVFVETRIAPNFQVVQNITGGYVTLTNVPTEDDVGNVKTLVFAPFTNPGYSSVYASAITFEYCVTGSNNWVSIAPSYSPSGIGNIIVPNVPILSNNMTFRISFAHSVDHSTNYTIYFQGVEYVIWTVMSMQDNVYMMGSTSQCQFVSAPQNPFIIMLTPVEGYEIYAASLVGGSPYNGEIHKDGSCSFSNVIFENGTYRMTIQIFVRPIEDEPDQPVDPTPEDSDDGSYNPSTAVYTLNEIGNASRVNTVNGVSTITN